MDFQFSEERKFYQARYFEMKGQTQQALQLYAEVLEGPLPADDPLRVSAQRQTKILQGQGDFGDRFELHLKNFFQETTRPSTLIPMLAGTAVFQVSRLATLNQLARLPASWFSRGLGAQAIGWSLPFGAELATFVFSGHGIHAGTRDWASAALSLGLLKISGSLAPQLRRAMPQAPSLLPQALGASSLVGGLFVAGRLEEYLGWREKRAAGTAIFEAISSALSLSLGAKLAHRLLGNRLQAPIQELELRLQESRHRIPLWQANWAIAGGGIPKPLLMAAGDGTKGGGASPSTISTLLNSAKKLIQARPGLATYLLLDFQNQLRLLKPQEISQFLLNLDQLLSSAKPAERSAMLPAWWETLKLCGPAEIKERANQYAFWLKSMPPQEIPALAKAMLEIADKLDPVQFNKLAALSLKRTLVESRRGIEDPLWVGQLFQRLSKSSRDGLIKALRLQLAHEEIGLSRNAMEFLTIIAPQLGNERLLQWARELLKQAPTANPLMQGAMWRGIQVLVEQMPATERQKVLPALREAMRADYGHHPSPFLFVTLGKAIDSLAPAAANLLTRELLLKLSESRAGMVKGLLVLMHERLDRLSPQNRELFVEQLENLFDAREPELRSSLLAQTSSFSDIWNKLNPIEQATLLRRWEKGLSEGDPESVLRQVENLLFTSPTFNIDRKIELFLRLDEMAEAESTPQALKRSLTRNLQKLGEAMRPEEKALLITNSRNRRPSQGPFPMAGYLLKGLSHPEAPALAAALSLNAADWPQPLSRSFHYPQEFAEWQNRIFAVLSRDKEAPKIQPVELDLGELLPIHQVHRFKGGGNFIETIEEMRERIFRSLILDGWRPGRLPRIESLREAMTSTDLHYDNRPPLIGTAAASGISLLVDGHHRVSSLITLVGDGHLPAETLRRIPLERVHDHSSQGILDEALGQEALPSFGWKDVLGFHAPSLKLLDTLSYQNTIERAFSKAEEK